mmetsp:Transcript_4204/g.17832  ORF Transcript_4204/g.17832 Transcript_4204/m.17832 type:complete len:312 (-) Transcript_4204:1210-2145(-)
MEEADVRLIEIRRRWPWFTYHRQPSVVVAYPESPRDDCPVALFMHGFVQMPTGYKTMLRSIARKGIMVVAVHLYTTLRGLTLSVKKEAGRAEEVIDWIFSTESGGNSLRGTIDENFSFPNSLTVIAHSRGAAALMNMALQRTNTNEPTIRAVVLLDPIGSIDVLDRNPKLPQDIVIFGCMRGIAEKEASEVYWQKLVSAGYRPLFVELDHFGHVDFLDDGKVNGRSILRWSVPRDRDDRRRTDSRDKISELIGIYIAAVYREESAVEINTAVQTALTTVENDLGMRLRRVPPSPAPSSNVVHGLRPASVGA